MTIADDNGEIQERQVRPFADWLTEQREGSLALELSEGLNQLVDQVNTCGKGGTLTLKISVKPTSKGASGSVVVRDDVTLKAPEPERSEALYFVDRDANLRRHNPAQPSLPLREVPQPSDKSKTDEGVQAQ